MSGPNAEFAPLHVRTSVETSLWPLRMWADRGEATIECGECDHGVFITAQVRAKDLMIADLTARVEAHIPHCTRTRDRS